MTHATGEERARICVGISGRICAGKTTAAHFLRERGFSYTRCSLVIDAEAARKGESLNRETRQRLGAEIHRTKGQRWLCEKALNLVSGAPAIVVDGLRFPDDHLFFKDQFSNCFVHLHVVSRLEIRARRYEENEQDGVSFAIADTQPVEAQIDSLTALAHGVLRNERTVAEFTRDVWKQTADALDARGAKCPSQLS